MTTKLTIRLLLLWVLAQPAISSAATFNVEIRNFYFTPTNLVIQPGDTVVWRNTSFTSHDTTHRAPIGSRVWASRVLAQNETFTHTFTQSGVFPYMCALHIGNFPQQTGTVSVAAANFPLTLSSSPPAGGTVSATPPPGEEGYTAGTSVSVTATPAEGFTFTGWSGDAAGTQNPVSVVMNEAKAVTANFSPVAAPVFALTTTVDPATSGSINAEPAPNAGDGMYVQGTVVTLTAIPAAGFAFTNWSGAASGTSITAIIVMNSNQFATAHFVIGAPAVHRLDIEVTPLNGGNVVVTPPSSNGTYAAGTHLALAAQPAPGFRFVRWTLPTESTDNPIPLLLNADKLVSVVFEPVGSFDFASVRGAYSGLLEAATNYAASAAITMRVSKTGAFRGTAWIGGMRTSLSGQFDQLGYAPLVVRRATLTGSLSIESDGSSIIGYLADAAGTTASILLAPLRSTTNEFTGSYRVEFPAQEPVMMPGTATIVVRANGVTHIRGTLGDGTSIFQRTSLTPDGKVPLFARLYKGRGAIMGWIELAQNASTVSWFRPADSRSVACPTGFALRLPVTIAGYDQR